MISRLKDQIESYSNYENNLIFYIDKDGRDHSVKENFSYDNWLRVWDEQLTIKVEGLENDGIIKSNFPHIKWIKNIHLFVKLRPGFSFDWHRDDINVYLHCVQGKKMVFVEDNKYTISTNEGVNIKKGELHKVRSNKNTWALSIGYTE